jgi:hypothetical protein
MEEALHNATNPDEFRMRTAGILSSDQAIAGTQREPEPETFVSATDERSLIVKH